MPRKSAVETQLAQQRIAMRPALLDVNQDYTIDEAAVMLCSSRQGVYRLARAGVIKIKKRGTRSRVSGRDILRANQTE